MDNSGLDAIFKKVADVSKRENNVWQMMIEGVPMLAVTDERADRMRIMSPIGPAENLDAEIMMRIMQANFDSALDARYAVAQGQVWSVFIHPLSNLDAKQVISGLAQVANCVTTFGTSFSSGVFVFGGGDSQELERNRLDRLLKKGEVEL
ncbi:MAG: type III secretion system chaperone [Myxococcota bacterium]